MSEPSSPKALQSSAGPSAGHDRPPPPELGEESLTPLEREVLEEYAKLRDNLDQISPLLANLATRPTPAILDALRVLERKTSLVSTLLKASVYSIVLQQEMFEGEGEGQSRSMSEGQSQDGP